jgi:PadR family transcriptional regulator PadR
MEIDRWKTQMRKGAAELVVLSLLVRQPNSGVALLKRIQQHSEIGLSGGALYPLLSRLEREKKIQGQWSNPTSGRAEKSYTVTTYGLDWFDLMCIERAKFETDLTTIIEAKS